MPPRGLLGTSSLTPPPADPIAALGALPTGGLLGQDITPDQLGPAPNVSPDEQQQYDQVVNNAYKALYSDMPTLLKSISGSGDPVIGLANTAANAMSRVFNSAKEAGQDFSEGVILNAGVEVLEDLAGLAEDAEIHVFTPEELESATYLAAEVFRSLQQDTGNIDPNGAAADFEQIQQAEASGSIEQLLPGVQEQFGDFRQPALQPGSAPALAPAAGPAGPPRRGLVG